MAALTGRAFMSTGERESSLIVVEGRGQPRTRAVTLRAQFSQGSSVCIHVAVAIETLGGCTAILTVLMACLACDLRMSTGQREAALLVVKGALPRAFVMTCLAMGP
jgi:hypothetical protein